MMAPQRPNRLFRFASLCVSVLLTMGGVELILRLRWLKGAAIGAGLEHPHFHHRLKSSHTYHYPSKLHEFDVHIRTNRFGLRGPDPVLPKPAGTIRILMLGDSYTFGFPVQDDETFCALIEQGLKAKGFPVDVVNAGVSSYSPTLHYISLRDEFLAFDPDLVVLWYDLGDLQDDYRYQKNLLYDASGRIVGCDPRYVNGRFDWREWAKTHSALASYLDKKVWRTMEKLQVLGLRGYLQAILHGERAKVAIGRLKGKQVASDLLDYEGFLLVREFATEELIKPYWSVSAKSLIMIRDLLAQRQIPFVLGIYPYGMLVGPDQWAEGRVYWGFEKGKTYDGTLALATFTRFSAEEHVPLINTFESFRAAAQSAKLFYDWDGHMTPEGQRVLAAHVLQDPQFLALLRQQATTEPKPRSLDSPHGLWPWARSGFHPTGDQKGTTGSARGAP